MDIEFKDEFFARLKKIDKAPFLKKMTEEAGTIAVNFSKQRFRDKNWVDKKREPWKKRKRDTRKGSTLVASGRLKRSIKKLASGNYYVFIGTDVPYAKIHNEGGRITGNVTIRAHKREVTYKSRQRNAATNRMRTVKRKVTQKVSAHKRRMNTKIPQRQFLGSSFILAKSIENYMLKQVERELKD